MLVAIEPSEAMIVRRRHLSALGLLQLLPCGLDAVPEDVAHGDETRARIGAQCLARRTGIAAAAANHADLDDVAAGGMGAAAQVERADGGR